MGKALVIKDANFSINGVLVDVEEVTPNWISEGFLYSNDKKIYSESLFRVYAFHLVAGQTITYSMTQGESTATYRYGRVQVGIADGHITKPSPTASGVSIGTVTPIKTIKASAKYQAIPKTLYTAPADVTFFIGADNGDTIIVYTEI